MYYAEMNPDFLALELEPTEFHATVYWMCEYRSPQFDGGTQQGRMIPCRNKAAMWTDRGLRCKDHRRD